MSRPRDRLRALLEKEGFVVDFFDVPRGYWRQQDCHRWEAWATKAGMPVRINLVSWDTMTKCARRGIVITEERSWYFDVSAAPAKVSQ